MLVEVVEVCIQWLRQFFTHIEVRYHGLLQEDSRSDGVTEFGHGVEMVAVARKSNRQRKRPRSRSPHRHQLPSDLSF